MSSADLTRALNRNRSELPKMLVVAEQHDELIGYISRRSNIGKDLNQNLIKLRKSVALIKEEYDKLAEERSVVDARKKEKLNQRASSLPEA